MLCAVLQSITGYSSPTINQFISFICSSRSLPYTQTHTQTCPEATVWRVALLTFHCILHVQGEEVPHDLSADLAHTQLLWKPGGIKTDSNQNHFRVMTRLTGWPDGLAQPESLTNDLTDVKEWISLSNNPPSRPHPRQHSQNWLNWGRMEMQAEGLKDEKKHPGGNDTAKGREGGSLFGK